MRRSSTFVILGTLLSFTLFPHNIFSDADPKSKTLSKPSEYAEYVGRYTDGADYVVYFKDTKVWNESASSALDGYAIAEKKRS